MDIFLRLKHLDTAIMPTLIQSAYAVISLNDEVAIHITFPQMGTCEKNWTAWAGK